ncbi:MAG: DUF1156 domain-containing protein [bacterium]|nr:DUF1156 domain-containing protein [bacterium]
MTELRRKLIEVALPLDAINAAAAKEKSIRHGHPSTLHLWWARRPLAACRAVLFASLVDDPSAHPDKFPTDADQAAERKRLFEIIERLVPWKNSNNSDVLAEAHAEIAASCDGKHPAVLDPFAGGGSIPLEAQRLGLEVHASDLNPVAVLINKAMIEIPPRFAGRPPIHPDQEGAADLRQWSGAQGLAADVRYYGRWMRDEAQRRIGHLYPKVDLPPEHGGGEANVIAWLWARTVPSPDPAWRGHVPLVKSFLLSNKKARQVWVQPVVDRATKTVRYEVRTDGDGEPPEGTVTRQGARCLATGAAMPFEHIRAEGRAGRMGQQLLAIVAEGDRQRVYLEPSAEHAEIAQATTREDVPTGELSGKARANVANYGLTRWSDLFTARQLTALTTFSDLVDEARQQAKADAAAAVGWVNDPTLLRDGGSGGAAYAEAISVYLAFALSKMADRGSTICTWFTARDSTRNTFARQAIPMTWDFAEANTLLDGTGSFLGAVGWTAESVEGQQLFDALPGIVSQLDAAEAPRALHSRGQAESGSGPVGGGRPGGGRAGSPPSGLLVSTDPPYYDNIGYADLSDFFYVWLRRCLASVYPDVCATLLVPKAQELVATPYRFDGDRRKAEEFFESGLNRVFERLAEAQDERFPMTVYYAFKQAETTEGGVASTGWETILQSLINAGLVIVGTWPIATELRTKPVALGANALASSIVLVCRRRSESAPLATRREFLRALEAELPAALRLLREGGIAPVDMAQAAIGPGMAVFSRYARVMEASGETMRVRTALELINETLDEVTEGIDAEFDYDTRWAVSWFAEYGFEQGEFGRAELLSKSRNTSVVGLAEAGIVASGAGKVRLLRRDELDPDWDPATDGRFTVWEVAHHLIHRIHHDGEAAAAALLGAVGGHGEAAKELAYRLYLVCERKGWAAEALDYNSLVTSWPELTRLAATAKPTQAALL